MNPLCYQVYAQYPRHTAPVDAEKAILKALRRLQVEDGMTLLQAVEFLMERTIQFAKEWEMYVAKEGKKAKKYTPYPASWYNEDGFREEPFARFPELAPEADRTSPTEEWAKANWEQVREEFSLPWGDERYWKPSWDATWKALPSAVRSELLTRWKP